MSDELTAALALLAEETRPVRTIDLTRFSDLGRSRVGEFRAAWAGLSAARRLELITAMVEHAEANIHVNFHAVLRICLSDPEAQVRRLAIEGLWEDEKVSLIALLTGLLADDPAVDVRAAAATSLGRFALLGALGELADEAARAIEEPLQAAWHRRQESKEVRRRALESLAYANTADVRESIRSAYYDEDASMRQSAVFAMGRSADPCWSRLVLAELGSDEPAMRFEAATAAGEMAMKGAVQPLIDRLDDPDSNVAEAAVAALGKIGGPLARRALQALLEGEDEHLADAAEDALEELTFNAGPTDEMLLDAGRRPGPGRRGTPSLEPEDFDDEDEAFDEEEWGEADLRDEDDDLDMPEEEAAMDWDDDDWGGDDTVRERR